VTNTQQALLFGLLVLTAFLLWAAIRIENLEAEVYQLRGDVADARCGLRVYEDLSFSPETVDNLRFECYSRIAGNRVPRR
jgi:hypothetical protein